MTNATNTTTDRAAMIAKLNEEKATHDKAFDLVSPQSQGRHWKDRIGEYLTVAQMVEADVSVDQIKAAIMFFTGTMPRALIVCTGDTILEENGITVGLLRREGGHTAEIQGWVFLADGYRAGPCGDH